MLEWTKRSQILWTAEAEGRRFRIQKPNSTFRGAAKLVEVDDHQRVLRSRVVGGYHEGRKVAQEWLQGVETAL